jgi:hypothetical protein
MMTTSQRRICAIRLPGTSRARFADAADVAVSLGDWVVIDTGAGEEAGQIVVAPDQWTTQIDMDDVPRLIRCLDDMALDELGETIDLARTMIDPAARVMRQTAPGTFLTGFRLTLDRSSGIVVYLGPEPAPVATVQNALTQEIGRPVMLEQDHPSDPDTAILGGGIGRPMRDDAETFQALLAQRIDVISDPASFAPHGMPRLGSDVTCEAGDGRLVAVDIRRWQATVRLANGSEINVSVNSLRQSRR